MRLHLRSAIEVAGIVAEALVEGTRDLIRWVRS